MPYAAAIAISDIRPMTERELADWEQWRSRGEVHPDAAGPPPGIAIRGTFTADVEHAASPSGTLCGIPLGGYQVLRHQFAPYGRLACPTCRSRV